MKIAIEFDKLSHRALFSQRLKEWDSCLYGNIVPPPPKAAILIISDLSETQLAAVRQFTDNSFGHIKLLPNRTPA